MHTRRKPSSLFFPKKKIHPPKEEEEAIEKEKEKEKGKGKRKEKASMTYLRNE